MIYLDNAATTFPKPEAVYERMDKVNRTLAFNAGRGSYKVAREATNIIDEARAKLISLVHGNGNESVVLCSSATEAMNIVLKGIDFKKGDTVVISPYEHNAVARALETIKKEKGINIELIPLNKNSLDIDLDAFQYLISKTRPKLVCCTHISNVTGYILPIKDIFELAKSFNAITILDSAQSLGLVDIDVNIISADIVVFAGHKTLYGPFGVGGFINVNGVELNACFAGGTGSDSLNLDMPRSAPGKHEYGSKNIVAIAGLCTALDNLDVVENFKKEKDLSDYLIDGLSKVDEVKMYLPRDLQNHIGVVSFNVEGYLAEDIGTILDEDFDIAVRTGYHCAPYIHDYLMDKQSLGTVRIGLGQFTTKKDIDALVNALFEIIE